MRNNFAALVVAVVSVLCPLALRAVDAPVWAFVLVAAVLAACIGGAAALRRRANGSRTRR
ncbi:hypothetical protein [Streptomyces sp. NPDC055186]